MQTEEIPFADDEFISWMKRPITLNAKKAKELIDDLEEIIIDLRKSLQGKTVLQKNMIYCQIKNRETQIKYANTFL